MTENIVDKQKLGIFFLNGSIALLTFLTLFVNKWFIIVLLPIVFIYGAIKRGENKINGLRKVRLTDIKVGGTK